MIFPCTIINLVYLFFLFLVTDEDGFITLNGSRLLTLRQPFLFGSHELYGAANWVTGNTLIMVK